MKILSVENLSRAFGGIKANNNISFEVEEGTILGVIGPNGAGKSTLFDLITGYTKADTGKVKFFDKFHETRYSFLVNTTSYFVH